MKRMLARSLVAALCLLTVAQAGADSVARGALELARTGSAPASAGVPRLVLATPDPAIASPAQVGSAWDARAWRMYGRGIALSARGSNANVVAIPLGPFAGDPVLASWVMEPIVRGVVDGRALAAIAPAASVDADLATLHEFDLPPLEAALRGGAGAVVCTLPGAPWTASLCRDKHVLATVLERDVRFDGFVSGTSFSELTTIVRVRAAAKKAGLYLAPPLPMTPTAKTALSRHLVQSGAVLLKNDGGVLPLNPATTRSILVVGADDATRDALAAVFPRATVTGQADWDAAARTASHNSAVIAVLRDPDPADSTRIAALVAANPRTIAVVERAPTALEGAGLAPAALLAWDPVLGTAAGVANVISGAAAPAGRLAVASAQYPIGAGLTYTTFAYSGFAVTYGHGATPVTVSFTLRNTGTRAGTAVARLTLAPPQGGAHLASFARVTLSAGRARRVTMPLGARAFAVWSPSFKAWYVAAGEYTATVLDGAAPPVLTGSIRVVSR